jgi:hypothetical protein
VRMILAEARARLEASPGAGLVSVIAQQASAAILGLHYDLALERAEEAIALAAALDLPAPYRALMARGEVRFGTDSRGGEEDYRRAIDEAEEQGDLHAASVAFYDLAAARGESFGPTASLAAFDEGIDFSEQHGLHMEWMRVGRLQPLFLAGRWDSLEEEAAAASRWAAERGDALDAHEADQMLAMIRLERGKPTGPLGVLVTAASDMGVSGAGSAAAAA